MRLEFLDGIRGLAALAVVIHHVAQFSHAHIPWLELGREAVVVFFVLSGFVLMLPVARQGAFPGGVGRYFLRRARRILPPYWAAVVIGLIICCTLPVGPDYRELAIRRLNARVVLVHLALIHNFDNDWVYGINPTLWTIPFEAQLYILLPLLIVPIWRGGGSPALLLIAALLAFGPEHHPWQPVLLGWPTFVFCIGVAGAGLAGGGERFATFAAGVILTGALLWWTDAPYWAAVQAGAALAVILVLSRTRLLGLRDLLESRPLLALGGFSYSLYLIHTPVIALVLTAASRNLGLSGVAVLAFGLIVGVPLALGVAYVFHRLFERPFLAARRA